MRPRQRRRGGLLAALLVLGFFMLSVAAVFAGWQFLARPAMEERAISGLTRGLQDVVATASTAQVTGAQAGEYTLTKDDVNAYLAEHASAYGPVDHVRVTELRGDGSVVADVTAFGFSSTVTTHVQAVNGRIQVTGTSVDGPAAWFFSGEDLDRRLTDEANTALDQQGMTVDSLRFSEDAITVVLG